MDVSTNPFESCHDISYAGRKLCSVVQRTILVIQKPESAESIVDTDNDGFCILSELGAVVVRYLTTAGALLLTGLIKMIIDGIMPEQSIELEHQRGKQM